MGSYQSLYIGPYIVVTGSKKIQVDKTIRTCSNLECEKNLRNKEFTANFCSTCGSLVETKKYKETENISPSSLLYRVEEFVDELRNTIYNSDNDEREVFVSNEALPFSPKRMVDEEFFDIDLININHVEEMDWFKNKFGEIISYFEKELGKDSVELKWGIVQWYS